MAGQTIKNHKNRGPCEPGCGSFRTERFLSGTHSKGGLRIPVKGDYAHGNFPSFRYFVKIKEDDDWESMSGQTVVYDTVFPYPKLGPKTKPPPSAAYAQRKTLRPEKAKSILKNASAHPHCFDIGNGYLVS